MRPIVFVETVLFQLSIIIITEITLENERVYYFFAKILICKKNIYILQ